MALFLNACSWSYCDLRDKSIGGLDKRFKETEWKQFDKLKEIDYPDKYYPVLEDREEMVCDLIQRVLKRGDDYRSVKIMLGDGFRSTNFPAAHFLKDDLEEDLFRYCIRNPKVAFEEQELLVYTVGYNASGDCYLGLVFKNKKYQGCFRAFAI